MKKQLLILTLVLSLVLFYPVFGFTSAAPEGKVHKVSFEELKNAASKNGKGLTSYKQFLGKEGHTLVIYGAPVDRTFVFEHLLKGKKVPYLFGEGELKKETKKTRKEIPSTSVQTNQSSGKVSPHQPSNQNQKQYTTKMIIYNYQGELSIQFETYHLPKNTDLSNVITQEEVKKNVMSQKGNQQILEFQNHVQEIRDNHPRGKKGEVRVNGITHTDATFIGDLVDYAHVYDNHPETGQAYLVGRHTTNWYIYNAEDQDPDYDHIIIWADVQADPVDVANPALRAHTAGYQGDILTYYYEDLLTDWDPSTTSLQKDNGENVGNFSVGFPASVSFSFNWNGENNAELQAVGDKTPDVGWYYNFWKNSWGAAWPVATNTFENEYGVMFRVDTLGGTLTEVEAHTYQNFATAWWGTGQWSWGNAYYHLYQDY